MDSANTRLHLIAKLRREIAGFDDHVLAPFIDAFARDAAYFDSEPWHNTGSAWSGLESSRPASDPDELLLRFDHGKLPGDAEQFHLAKLVEGLGNDPERWHCFDMLVVLTAVSQTLETGRFPVSINISSYNAVDGAKLIDLHSLISEQFSRRVAPAQIVFEFLEYHQADRPCVNMLRAMRDIGYRFALDDVSPRDLSRLRALGPHVDVIKIDGRTLEDIGTPSLPVAAFRDFMQCLQHAAPQGQVVIEWVKSPQQAAALARAFPRIDFVQGRQLSRYTPDQFNQAFAQSAAARGADDTTSPAAFFSNGGAPSPVSKG